MDPNEYIEKVEKVRMSLNLHWKIESSPLARSADAIELFFIVRKGSPFLYW